MKGDAHLYGMKPGCSSGNYQKHIDKVLGFDEAKRNLYVCKVPAVLRKAASRAPYDLPLQPPHELTDQELESDLPSLGNGLLRSRVAHRQTIQVFEAV